MAEHRLSVSGAGLLHRPACAPGANDDAVAAPQPTVRARTPDLFLTIETSCAATRCAGRIVANPAKLTDLRTALAAQNGCLADTIPSRGINLNPPMITKSEFVDTEMGVDACAAANRRDEFRCDRLPSPACAQLQRLHAHAASQHHPHMKLPHYAVE
ncbi:hypothetical protein [Caballeronia catudaia]|uniref:hypothetical protein n=1 Tax=Caballeronia catudaia TaxID=1777136 RepID=UPI0011812330|nr:hypothetical protein [Caballeronia catudaia]